MRTSKHVIILLTVALARIATAGQDQSTTPSQAAPRGPSDTRSASCMVRITVDPAILPLNGETVDSLIHSPAVLLKAGRDVLALNTPEGLNRLINEQGSEHSLITIRWLNSSSAPMSPTARLPRQGRDYGNQGYDEEMMRQLEQIYSPGYMQQMMERPVEEKKEGAKEDRPGTSGTGAGATGGVGGMGMSGGALPAPEPSAEVRRLPGESDVAYRTRLAQVRAAVAAQQQAREIRRSPGESDVAYRTRLAQIRAQETALQMQMKGRGMGGMGMGGMGMGGMGGGMMAGYGGAGGMGFYGVPGSAQQGPGMEQSATIELQVSLPDTVPPRADEFLKAVVRNLQDSLMGAYNSYRTDLRRILLGAKEDSEFPQSRRDIPGGPIPAATMQIRKQLNMEVDLSPLNRQMPLAGAIDALRKAVEPPLNIVVLWKDLRESLAVEPTSPINIDGMPRVKLGTMLDLLVKGFNPGDAKAIWKIENDVIVIGTPATLGRSQEGARQPTGDAEAVNLVGQRSELTRRAQALELDLAGLDARQAAIGAQTAGVRQRVNEKVSKDPVIYELEKLAEIRRGTVIKDSNGRLVPVSTPEEQEKAIRAKIELANRREELSKQVGGSQLEEFNKELSRMAIDKAEKEAQLQIVRRQLDDVQKQLAQALAFDPEAARLRMAQESLDITARRVAELQMRLSNLEPPMVTMIGAN